MPVTLPPLPYAHDALQPYMSAKTVRFHYDGKQARYVRNTNEIVRDIPRLQNASLATIMQDAQAARRRSKGALRVRANKLFDQASQAWTHAMFWRSMRPRPPGQRPVFSRSLERYIDPQRTKDAFKREAMGLFGSGWVWLCLTDGRQFRVQATQNAEQPAGQPLLVCDLWEHAYYLDYPDAKGEFLDVWLDHLVDWDFAEQMFSGAIPQELR